jgi:hypothetical protein
MAESEVGMERPKTMGRKKSDPPDMPPRQSAFTIKGTAEWKAWVERAADHCRDSVSSLFDKAVADYVKAHGFEEPPPRR